MNLPFGRLVCLSLSQPRSLSSGEGFDNLCSMIAVRYNFE